MSVDIIYYASSVMRHKVRVGLWALAIVFVVIAVMVGTTCFLSKPAPELPPMVYTNFETGVSVVEIKPMEQFEVRAVLVDRKLARGESFRQLMKRFKPYAAINGTFYGDRLEPLGDVVTDGKLVNKGRYPNAIAVTNDGKVEFVRREGKRFDWSGYKSALAAGPRLIHEGKVHLDPLADGFTNMSLKIRAARSGVGITKTGSLLFVVAQKDVTLGEFAKIMVDLGAVEAMNLDGGPACALYQDGEIMVEPRLPMTNLLLVYRKQE